MPGAERAALRGQLLDFRDDPAVVGPAASQRYLEDGLLLIENGRIAAAGAAQELLPGVTAGTPVDHWPDCLILPGLIDAHIHFPQTQVIASFGAQLLDWLQNYTFVEEQRFGDPAHAARIASFFLDELARNGTTTAVVYGSVHPQSADAFFAESARRNTRMIAGKVMMDRGAPEGLLDTAERGYDESNALIARWHRCGRQLYAISPRFALTSSDAQLEAAGALAREHPDCYVQTHLSENHEEIAAVRRLFPWADSYAHVYDRFGLLGPRSIFGHCLHLSAAERERLSATGSVAAFCPTSNLFLGSGLFDLAALRDPDRPVRVGVATDVGGGTSYSLLRTAAEGYKVLQLRGQTWPALDAFYALTLGNARALGLEDEIGTLEPGTAADLVVLDPRATPAMAHRMERIAGDLAATLFLLMMMGDERAVRATYVMGERQQPDMASTTRRSP
ncbi:MAG TPA: guanine deaminase [Geminicoccaceae bacterium]|nr:guanine deaminase [Geminicoccaceae bacterium]